MAYCVHLLHRTSPWAEKRKFQRGTRQMSTAVEAIKKHHAAPFSTWHDRLRALRNIPPVLRMLRDAAPRVVVFDLFCRLFSALIPLALLVVGRYIIDDICHLMVY